MEQDRLVNPLDDDAIPSGLTHKIGTAMANEAVEGLLSAALIQHPGERGRARENVLKTFLRAIVPSGFGVGEGFVVDSSDRMSRQQDVVVFRRDYHPTFQVGGITYFPVESVSACLEVKSRLDSDGLRSALHNSASVKSLDRTAGGSNYIVLGGSGGERREPVDPSKHEHQVLSAILGAEAVGVDTLVPVLQKYLGATARENWPNVIAVAENWSIQYDTVEDEDDDRPRSDTMAAVGLRVAPADYDINVEPLLDVAEQLWSFLRVAPIIDVMPARYIRGSWVAADHLPLTVGEGDVE